MVVVVRGVRILKKKTSHLAHKTGVRLKRLMFNREEPPPNTRITIIITGVSEDNMYAAQVEMEAYREGTTLSTSDLPDVKLLVLGCFGGWFCACWLVRSNDFPNVDDIVRFK